MPRMRSAGSRTIIPLLLATIMLNLSCASSYRAINPTTINYSGDIIPVDNDIEIKYQYNVLRESRNKKYAKYEERSNYRLIGMLISNQGYDTLYFSEDLVITDGLNELQPLALDDFDRFTQSANKTFLNDDDFDEAWFVTVTHGLFNDAVASTADRKFMDEMEVYYLVDSAIPPGAIVSGLVALPVRLNVRLKIWKRER